MRKIYLTLVLCVCAFLLFGTGASAYAQNPGQTCSTAIPMTENFSVQISSPKTVWYSAWTFDLPLTVTFAPKNNNTNPAYAPVVEMDFTCTPGEYDDEILCSLFCKKGGQSGIDFDLPHSPKLQTKTLDDGTFVYYLSLGKSYRDLLLKVGISYNVQVFVKVTFKCAGELSLAPDDLFSNCVDKAKFMHFGDTVKVSANDKSRHVIVPYVQWQEDTIYYKWTGTKPCSMAVANTCDFDPTNALDGNIIQRPDPIQPGDSIKVLATSIYDWVHNPEFPNEAGMYFAKFYSEAPGVMEIIQAPKALPRGQATILRMNQTYMLNANETALYAIPNSWNDEKKNTKFETPTDHVFRMTIANDPDFSEEHTLKTYQFERSTEGHWQGILGTEMANFWKKAIDQYLYVRFDCNEATTITPSEWTVSACVKSTAYINKLDTTIELKRNSDVRYRFNYSQLVGGDLTFSFNSTNACKVFIATDCSITTSATAANLLGNGEVTSEGNLVFNAETIAGWAERVPEDGYIYMRYHYTQNAKYKITVQSSAPRDVDPEYDHSTLALECGEPDGIFVRVNEDQHVTVKSKTGATISEWDAVAGTLHAVNQASGTYSVCGEEDTIQLVLPASSQSIKPIALLPAGISPDMPTRVSDTTALTVQSGSNYVRMQPINLPATITYLLDTAFGTTPAAFVRGEEVPAQMSFADCAMSWKWEIPLAEEATTVELKAHENATILVEPYVCPKNSEMSVVAWDQYKWKGTTYTESGVYINDTTNEHGCEWTRTLDLTIHKTTYQSIHETGCDTVIFEGKIYTVEGDYIDTIPNGEDRMIRTLHVILGACPKDSTIYFCPGLNYEHTIERDGVVLKYRQYRYEEPSADWYMAGVIVANDNLSTLVDLQKAEKNLRDHYANGLIPVKSVQWSCRAPGESELHPIAVSDKPQWIANDSRIEMTVRFLCGEVYYSSFTTDIESVNGEQVAESVKRIEKGQLVIIRGGKKYSVLGTRIE